MRIIVWGINYAPEVTGIGPCNTALCEHLSSVGHEVEMVTSFPYYPVWRKQPEDEGCLYRTDVLNNVPVHRCWHFVPRVVKRWKRIPHEASFVFMSLLRVLSLRRADVLVVVSPPLLLGLAAFIAAWWHGAPFVFHVQDLQPDAALGLGMLKPGRFTRLLQWLERFSYERAWRVSGISPGMIEAFRSKGVPAEKCVLFPNGISLQLGADRGRFRARHGFAAEQFLLIYSGNIGVKQGLDFVIEGMRALENERVQLVVCGDGADRARIVWRAREMKNVHFLPLLPETEYREMLADCDAALISQVAGSGRAFFPSKLLPAFAAGCAVLSVADGESELAQAIAESGGGINVMPGDLKGFGSAVERLAAGGDARAAYADAGRRWVSQFERERVLAKFVHELEKAPALD